MTEKANIQKRAPRTTKKQIEIMVNFLHENTLLLAGKVEPKYFTERDKQWNILVQLLNSCPQGPRKSLKDWKHVLKELKTNTRKKAREIYVDKKATGRGPSGKRLTDVEERLMGLLSKVSVEGAPIPEAGLQVSPPKYNMQQQQHLENVQQQEYNLEGNGFNLQDDLLLLPNDIEILQPDKQMSASLSHPINNQETISDGAGKNNIESNLSNKSKNTRYRSKSRYSDDNTKKLLEKQILETHNLSDLIYKLSESIFALSKAIEKVAQRE